jgi:hypothetical protein
VRRRISLLSRSIGLFDVRAAPLPGCTGKGRADGVDQAEAVVGVGRDQLDASKAASYEAAQECQPGCAVL